MPAAELPGSKTVQKKQPKASVRGLVGPNRLARLDAPLHGSWRTKSSPPDRWRDVRLPGNLGLNGLLIDLSRVVTFQMKSVAQQSAQVSISMSWCFQICCQLCLPFLTQLSECAMKSLFQSQFVKKTEIFTLPCFHWYDSCLWEFDYFLCEYCSSCLWKDPANPALRYKSERDWGGLGDPQRRYDSSLWRFCFWKWFR